MIKIKTEQKPDTTRRKYLHNVGDASKTGLSTKKIEEYINKTKEWQQKIAIMLSTAKNKSQKMIS